MIARNIQLLPNGMFPTNIDREWSCWNKY